ncbi:hypothetical protein XH93_11540 [Bradyrhizobium sp. CCBAU 51753]|nr:hypothetical protein XH93_11540 [Bradyrhizobium sp. CCBAU 51753]
MTDAVGQMICADAELRRLNSEMVRSYYRLLGDIPSSQWNAFTADHDHWRDERVVCSVMWRDDYGAAFAARQCLVDDLNRYLRRLNAFREKLPDRGGFLHNSSQAGPQDSSFVLLDQAYATAALAQHKLGQLQLKHPYLDFAVLEPKPDYPYWQIVLASFRSQGDAERALDFARRSGVSDGFSVVSLTTPAQYGPTANVVAYCYRSGAQTIQTMMSCSGALVTPATIDSCLKGGVCDLGLKPVALEPLLAQQGAKWNSPLKFQPPPDYLAECPMADAAARQRCIESRILPPVPEVNNCQGLTADPDAFGRCLISALPPETRKIALCAFELSTSNPLQCAGIAMPTQIQQAQTCIAKSPGETITPDTVVCFIGLIPNKYATLAGCIYGGNMTAQRVLACANSSGISDLVPRVALATCLINATDDLIKKCAPNLPDLADSLSCIQSQAVETAVNCLPTSNQPAIKCLKGFPDRPDAFVACYSKEVPQLQQLICIARSRSLSDAVAVCLADSVPEYARKVLACVLVQTDVKALLTCAAAPVLDDETQKIVTCAAGSERSYFELGLCLLGVKVNKEIAIVAKCAESSNGQAFVALGCAAGALTQREFNKCLANGIGGADGCFGPNNTVRITVQNILNDLEHGPSNSNEVVKFYHQILDNPEGDKIQRGARLIFCLGLC